MTASALFVAALIMEDTFLPGTWAGVGALVALAVISHTGGQGLLAFALGHLSAAFSSLVIFLEAVAAAFFGWLIFAEAAHAPATGRRRRHSRRHLGRTTASRRDCPCREPGARPTLNRRRLTRRRQMSADALPVRCAQKAGR